MRLQAILFFLLISFSAFGAELNFSEKVRYEVKVAKTADELENGLMFVHFLPKNQGMLFDMRGMSQVSMWMKNTYISLDMLFLDCNFKIVDIHQKAKPHSLEHITSDKNFCYVLEINGGEFQSNHLKIGDKADFNP